MVHQSKGKPFVPRLAQNPLLQSFYEKKYIQWEYISEIIKERERILSSEHSLSNLEMMCLISQTIILVILSF